jgi:TRAP transporter TAXI family solute receptor
MFSRRVIPVGSFFLMTFLFLLAFSMAADAQSKSVRLSIATGGTGGVYYVLGGGIAALISKYIPGYEATAEVTSASVDNLKLIHTQKADIAFTTADSALDAYKGLERFKAMGKVPLRALAVLYPSVSHIVTIEGTGIEKAADLKGKRVSTGAPGSGVEVTCIKIMDALGLDWNKDIRRERLGFTESVGAIKDRKLDAFFAGPGIPAAAILDLASTPGITIKIIAHDTLLEKINKKFGPSYFRFVIPKETYPGMKEPVPVIATGNSLACHEKLDEKIAYNVVKAIFEHKKDLSAVHKEADKITLQAAVVGSPVPFHPGAIKYYKENNVWPK